MTPLDPAAECPPGALRGARRTPVPGSAGAGTSQPPRCEVPAQTSLSQPAAATGTPDLAGVVSPASHAAQGRVRAKTPAAGVGASPAPSAGSKAYLDAYASSKMSEAELEVHVRAIIKDLGLLGYHTRDSRGSAKGFPDWTICGARVMFRELKTKRGKITEEQRDWLEALHTAGADTDVWRPEDLMSGRIARELAKLAGWTVTA